MKTYAFVFLILLFPEGESSSTGHPATTSISDFVILKNLGKRIWVEARWTGQPLLLGKNGRLYLIRESYDYNLKKIDSLNRKIA